jgi:hypothetical protein
MSKMPPEMVRYYTLCTMLVQPKLHLASYLRGQKQKIIPADELDKYLIERDGWLVPKETVIGGNEVKIVVIG